MHIILKKKPFLKALTHSNSIVERHTIVPILSYTLIKTHDQGVTLSSTDLNISLIENVPACIHESGSIALPTYMLFEIVRKLPDSADITLLWQDNQAKILAGKSDFSIGSLPHGDFPHIRQETLSKQFVLSGSVLLDLIQKTRCSMSTDDVRYYLNGVYLHIHDQREMRAVTTDGSRLAKAVIGIPQGAEDMPGMIMSRKTVNELTRLLSNIIKDVIVSFSKTQIAFHFEDIFFCARLVDGQFPDYHTVIPVDHPYTMQINRKIFADAIDRVATMASEKNPVMHLLIDKNKVIFQASSHLHGRGVEETDTNYHGRKIEIRLNAKYLQDAVEQISTEDICVTLKSMMASVLIHAPEDFSAVYVIMPMRD